MTAPNDALSADQNIDAILAIRARSAKGANRHQLLFERLAKTMARPHAIYVMVLGAGLWIALNGLAPVIGFRAWDPPPFPGLELVVSLLALFMTVTILTAQNRLAFYADERAHLELQVNLLAEQKIAKLIALVEELRVDMPNVRNRVDPVADAMKQAVDPAAVLDALSSATEQSAPLGSNRQPQP